VPASDCITLIPRASPRTEDWHVRTCALRFSHHDWHRSSACKTGKVIFVAIAICARVSAGVHASFSPIPVYAFQRIAYSQSGDMAMRLLMEPQICSDHCAALLIVCRRNIAILYFTASGIGGLQQRLESTVLPSAAPQVSTTFNNISPDFRTFVLAA